MAVDMDVLQKKTWSILNASPCLGFTERRWTEITLQSHYLHCPLCIKEHWDCDSHPTPHYTHL